MPLTSTTMCGRYPFVVLLLYISSALVEGRILLQGFHILSLEVNTCFGRTLMVPWISDETFASLEWRKSDVVQPIMVLKGADAEVITLEVNPLYIGSKRVSYISGSLSAGMKIAAFETADNGKYTVSLKSNNGDNNSSVTIAGIPCLDTTFSPQVFFNDAHYGVGDHIVDLDPGIYEIIVSPVLDLQIDVSVDGEPECLGVRRCGFSRIVQANSSNELSITVNYTYVDAGTFTFHFKFDKEEKFDIGAYYTTVILQPICLILHIIISLVAVKKEKRRMFIIGSVLLGSISFITMLATAIITCLRGDMYCGLHIGLGDVVSCIIIVIIIVVYVARFKRMKK